ncbi:putative membrane protein YeiB [Aquamicrobium terrae]|uniref:hypothetical protein n=1 Tax=Mesorhizobium sp. PUT5 TaxID=3454629 RepID=UPI003FA41960
MLARRFTIVCLLVTLFGMGFAMLVAEAGRSERHWEDHSRCGFACQTSPRL